MCTHFVNKIAPIPEQNVSFPFQSSDLVSQLLVPERIIRLEYSILYQLAVWHFSIENNQGEQSVSCLFFYQVQVQLWRR